MAFELVTDLDTVEVGLRGGDVLRRNPNARVPLLEDGDFVLWESRALRGYRASLHPEAGLVPHDSATQAPMDQWAWRQAIPPGPAMQKLSFGLFLKGKFGMGDADPATVASERKACDRFPDVPQKGAGRQGPDRRRPEPCRLLHRDKLHVSRSEPGFRPMPGPPPAPNLSRRPAASTPWDFAGDASRDRVSAIRLTASDRPGRKLRHRRSGPPAPICVRLRPFDVRQVRNHADRRSRPARQLRSGHVVAPEGISRAEAALGRRMRNKIA